MNLAMDAAQDCICAVHHAVCTIAGGTLGRGQCLGMACQRDVPIASRAGCRSGEQTRPHAPDPITDSASDPISGPKGLDQLCAFKGRTIWGKDVSVTGIGAGGSLAFHLRALQPE